MCILPGHGIAGRKIGHVIEMEDEEDYESDDDKRLKKLDKKRSGPTGLCLVSGLKHEFIINNEFKHPNSDGVSKWERVPAVRRVHRRNPRIVLGQHNGRKLPSASFLNVRSVEVSKICLTHHFYLICL